MALTAQTYANLLAHGVTSGGDVGPDFELWAGDTPKIATDQGQAADGQAIAQFEVLMHDAEGKYVPFTVSDNYATGSYVVGAQPTAADFITVNGEVITFIDTGTPAADEVLIAATTALTAQAIRDVINSDPELYAMTAAGTGTTVALTAIAAGTAGNSITITENVTSASFTVSGATLSGADASADTPSNEAVAVAGQACAAATPGGFFPVYVGGCFNHEALVWPAGIATLRQRKLAFAGTDIVVKQLL